MTDRINPIRDTDDEARALARRLMTEASIAALGVLDPETGSPYVSRIAVSVDGTGRLLTLVSDLSRHAAALRLNPDASILVGEPGPKGDALGHPRLTLQVRARFIPPAPGLRDRWLASHPKAKLYVDFADFRFVTFHILQGYLNGGFGKAFAMKADDLKLA
ncbi:MAG: pyridoxamine 5'-phosphate oxidase family protein [Paracoccaceae bacterium]